MIESSFISFYSTDLTDVISEISKLLPELSNYIDRFHQTLLESGVNVANDVQGNLSIDAPSTMSTSQLEQVGKKISIIDRLINTHDCTLKDLFQKGALLEESLKKENSSFSSPLLEYVNKYKDIRNSYNH